MAESQCLHLYEHLRFEISERIFEVLEEIALLWRNCRDG